MNAPFRPLFAKRAQTPQEGLAGESGIGAERIGARHVGAAADS